ncbi:DUF2550 domain-containing protein [Corynebacterium camporealensis]
MSIWSILGWLLAGFVLICACLAALRFFTLRSRGTTVLLRPMPAKDSHSWRHGLLRYKGETAQYFMLRSVWPTCDLKFPRFDIEILGTRQIDDVEATFMSEASDVVHFRTGYKEYEIASDQHGMMAFCAWIEAAPSRRQEKVDFKRLQQRATRTSKPE